MTHSAELKACLEITKKLRELPGAQLFNEPIGPDQPDYQQYYKTIKNPQDLGTILRRLENGEYTSSQQWEKDISQIWSNAEQYNGKDAYVSAIARHMSKHTDKLKRNLYMRKISGWMKNLYIWRDKLDKLLVSPPDGSHMHFIPETPYVPPSYPPFSSHDLDCLIEASRSFYKNDDLLNIIKIVDADAAQSIEVENRVINVDTLPPRTLYGLKQYFKKRLADIKEKYPD